LLESKARPCAGLFVALSFNSANVVNLVPSKPKQDPILMKTRYLALILAPLFSTAALAAGYTGPGAQSVTTVAAANDAADDTPVVLQGFVTKKINNDDKYEFKDNTGTITVEIDDEDLPPTPFNDKTKVKLTGEVEKHLMSREVDVDIVEIIN
jgi:uncharacterized protein (TIGR00156 family)